MILPGGIIGGALPSVVYGSYGSNTGSSATTRTVTGLSFSSEGNRKVAALIGHTSSSYATGVTIGGVSASMAARGSGNTFTRVEIWIADVPTGATGSVAVTSANAYALLGVGTFALYNISSLTPYDTASDNDNGSTITLDLDVKARGIALGIGRANFLSTSTPAAASWSGMTQGYSELPNSLTRETGGYYVAPSLQSPRSVSITGMTGSNFSGCAASFR